MYFDERENSFNYLNEKNKSNYDIDENKYYNYEKNNTIKFDNELENNYSIDKIIVNNYRNDLDLYNINEGFNKGNMFKNIYKPYKNYSYKVVVNGKRDEMLLKIQEICFLLQDLNLYLDIYPNDIEALKIFNQYNEESLNLKKEYSKMYGPLCLSDSVSNASFEWIKNPWPWENMGGKL